MSPGLESLEGRALLSTFTVTNVADSISPFQTNGNSTGTPDHLDVQRLASWTGPTEGIHVLRERGNPRSGVNSLTVSWVGLKHQKPGLGAGVPGQDFRIAPLGEVTGSATDLIATFGPVNGPAAAGPGDVDGAPAPASSAPVGSTLLASFAPGQSTGFGQSLRLDAGGDSGASADVADARALPGPASTGGSGAPVVQVAPWAPFAVGLDDGWQHLRARLTAIERSSTSSPTGSSGAVSRNPGLQTRTASNSNARTESRASETASRDGANQGTDPELADHGRSDAGAATGSDGPGNPVAGVLLLDPRAVEPTVTTIDAALDAFDIPGDQPDVAVAAEPRPVSRDTEPQPRPQPVMAIAAASLTLAVTMDRAIGVARRRSTARNRWRLR